MKNFGGFGGLDMNKIIKQAQEMQKKVSQVQEELTEKVFETTAGGGAVKVSINGKKEIQEIIISPEVVDVDDIEMLQDLIKSAVNEAVRKAEAFSVSEMEKITGFPGGLPK